MRKKQGIHAIYDMLKDVDRAAFCIALNRLYLATQLSNPWQDEEIALLATKVRYAAENSSSRHSEEDMLNAVIAVANHGLSAANNITLPEISETRAKRLLLDLAPELFQVLVETVASDNIVAEVPEDVEARVLTRKRDSDLHSKLAAFIVKRGGRAASALPETAAATEPTVIVGSETVEPILDIEADTPAQVLTYPRATALTWGTLASELEAWAKTVMPAGSSVICRAEPSIYADDAYGWNVIFDNATREDCERIYSVLAEIHGNDSEDAFSETEGALAGLHRVTLSNHVSELLVAKKILPTTKNAFPYGVNKSFTSEKAVMFISDYVNEAIYGGNDKFPRAISLDWDEIDHALSVWAATTFPKVEDLSILCSEVCESNRTRKGWCITLTGIQELEKPLVKLACEEFGKVAEYGCETMVLSCEASNKIMAKEILPKQTPAFNYGVDKTVIDPNGITFVSCFLP